MSVKNEQLVIKQEVDFTIPLEDLSTLMLENLSCTITSSALGKLAEYNVAVFTCDKKHIPNGVLHTFNSHSRQLKRLKIQMSAGKPLKKRIWQSIVKQKVYNQAICLELSESDGSQMLYAMEGRIESGDTTNIESQAARKYFTYLYGKDFIRRDDGCKNAALNYGYAIIRGCIARCICSYGLTPCLGVFHKSELNNFNLADDFLEPFRPVVDLWVSRYIDGEAICLTSNMKKSIYNLLTVCMIISDGKYNLVNVIEKMIISFIGALEKNDFKLLKLPQLIEFEMEEYD